MLARYKIEKGEIIKINKIEYDLCPYCNRNLKQARSKSCKKCTTLNKTKGKNSVKEGFGSSGRKKIDAHFNQYMQTQINL